MPLRAEGEKEGERHQAACYEEVEAGERPGCAEGEGEGTADVARPFEEGSHAFSPSYQLWPVFRRHGIADEEMRKRGGKSCEIAGEEG